MSLPDEINPDIKPGDDFYRYVNQKWLDTHPLPDDKARWGSFSVLSDENTERLRKLLESPDLPDDHVNLVRLRQFYRSAMDEEAIEAAGIEPVRHVLSEIEALRTTTELKAFLSRWHAKGQSLVWHAYLGVDDKNSRRYVGQIYQGGLALPEREYYLEDGEQFENVRAKYQTFLAEAFRLLGQSEPDKRAGRVFGIEKKLAEASLPAVERRDPDKMYNLYPTAQLENEFPGLDWPAYLSTAGFGTPSDLIVAQPGFMKAAIALLEELPAADWQDYFTIHCVLPVMNKLPKAFEQLHFDFFGKVLGGVSKQEPRYRRVIGLCERLLPQPTGQLFVSRHFDEEAKKTIYALVERITRAFAQRVEQLEWMSDDTKQKALEKLGTFLPLLGYPDRWRDYSALDAGSSYAANYLAAVEFEWNFDMNRLTEPVDRHEWLMSPAAVNAYYWSNTNGITFPAGILQPPFFDSSGDFAANYGGIGVVIGHELTHGFDDQGSKFDKDGNLRSWWTPKDRERFEAVAGSLAAQFDAYEVDGRKVNGHLTLGENIADLGGVMIALDAMHQEIEETGRGADIDGLSPEQRFFMSYARIWRQAIRPELALQFLVSDPHAPNQFRVNGIVPNVEEFYRSFKVKNGDALYRAPADRVRIW